MGNQNGFWSGIRRGVDEGRLLAATNDPKDTWHTLRPAVISLACFLCAPALALALAGPRAALLVFAASLGFSCLALTYATRYIRLLNAHHNRTCPECRRYADVGPAQCDGCNRKILIEADALPHLVCRCGDVHGLRQVTGVHH